MIPGLLISVIKIFLGERAEDDVEAGEIEPGEDGFLGEDLRKVKIVLKHGREEPLWVFTVDGKKNIVDLADKSGGEGDETVYVLNVVMNLFELSEEQLAEIAHRPSARAFHGARYPHNHLKVASCRDNILRLYEVAVVSQFGRHYLTVEQTAEVEVGLYKGNFNFIKRWGPDLRHWPAFVERIKELHESGRFKIGRLFKKPVDRILTPPQVTTGDAVVEWWNSAMGMGMVWTRKGKTARVHWYYVKAKPGERVKLASGQAVRVDKFVEPQSARGTNFKLEARGVGAME